MNTDKTATMKLAFASQTSGVSRRPVTRLTVASETTRHCARTPQGNMRAPPRLTIPSTPRAVGTSPLAAPIATLATRITPVLPTAASMACLQRERRTALVTRAATP
jgi:hypothetical protein